LLEGREREVTILFGDLRNFTKHATGLSPSETCHAITDVLECMTEAVRQTDGVVVDYAGDGIMAIWNAPSEQPQHADLAAHSALELLRELPNVSRKWENRLGMPFRVGIGINTGNALVGNTGTRFKFKYGASGNSVNLASRVESATKYIGVPILITQATRELLTDEFQTRRLPKIRVEGLMEPVGVYELHRDDPSGAWNQRRDLYELALSQFEQKEWAKSCQTIQPLLFAQDDGIGDLPSLMLAGRAIECLKSPPENFEAVIELDRK
jgi:adenylate cyclase